MGTGLAVRLAMRVMRGFLKFLGLALWLILPTAHAESENGLYLYQVELSGDAPGAFNRDQLHLRVSAENPDRLLDSLRRTTVDAELLESGSLALRVGPNAHFLGSPEARSQKDSWVVDFSEPSVQAMLETLRETPSTELTPDKVTEFTHAQITDKNYRNGFNIASQVARLQEGDCTEHAVLNAAFARASGYPARVVLGILIASGAEGSGAYGHAWNEIYVDDEWQVHDATLPLAGNEVEHAFYLPISQLANEGPGYTMGLVDFALVRPGKIVLKAQDDSN